MREGVVGVVCLGAELTGGGGVWDIASTHAYIEVADNHYTFGCVYGCTSMVLLIDGFKDVLVSVRLL